MPWQEVSPVTVNHVTFAGLGGSPRVPAKGFGHFVNWAIRGDRRSGRR
jgi:hypothetical protein